MSLEITERIDKVFGHLELKISIRENEVDSKFVVTQDARLIEAVIEGRKYDEAPLIASRICGACSIAHFLASVTAVENALGVELPEDAIILKEVMNKVQIAQNNAVHLFFLALPDYYNAKSLGELLDVNPDLVRQGFQLNNLCLKAVDLLAGRIVNPNTYRAGGFTKKFLKEKIEHIIEVLKKAEKLAKDIVEQVMELNLPELSDPSPTYLVAESPMGYLSLGDYIVGSDGDRFHGLEYSKYIEEKVVNYSNSKAYTYKGKVFHVGSRARMLAYGERLIGLDEYVSKLSRLLNNPFNNLKVKALEILYTIMDSREKLEELKDRKLKLRTEVKPREGEGVGIIEAPRGLLIHHYKVDSNGRVTYANVITPTAMNALHIEESAKVLGRKLLEENKGIDEVRKQASMLIRAYDPCLPCAVHVIVTR